MYVVCNIYQLSLLRLLLWQLLAGTMVSHVTLRKVQVYVKDIELMVDDMCGKSHMTLFPDEANKYQLSQCFL